jgi:hypothetical protein
MAEAQYVVLSLRNCVPEELIRTVDTLFKSFERLRHRAFWATSVRGALVSLELTFNRQLGTWHPHLNILIDGFLHEEELAVNWRTAARDEGLISSRISRVKRRAVPTVIGNMTKPPDFNDVPEAVECFLEATHRARLVRSCGCFYGVQLTPDSEPDARASQCPDCGSREIDVSRDLAFVSEVWLDERGVFRFHRGSCGRIAHVTDV